MKFKGTVVKGLGKASRVMSTSAVRKVLHTNLHEEVFPGTFNVLVDIDPDMFDQPYYEGFDVEQRAFYRLRVVSPKEANVWLYRRPASKMSPRVLELISRHNLHEYLGVGAGSTIELEYEGAWTKTERADFINSRKWFQSFGFLPKDKIRTDSNYVLNMLDLGNVWNKTVLDVGGHYGFHSIALWERGAVCTMVEKNRDSVDTAKHIMRSFVPADVNIIRGDFRKQQLPKSDVVLYLSVHHQIDPTYENLPQTLDFLAKSVGSVFCFEDIIPFGGAGNADGFHHELELRFSDVKYLGKYSHAIRGTRHIWKCYK